MGRFKGTVAASCIAYSTVPSSAHGGRTGGEGEASVHKTQSAGRISFDKEEDVEEGIIRIRGLFSRSSQLSRMDKIESM